MRKRFDIVCVDYVGQLEGNGEHFWERTNSVALILRAYNLAQSKLIMTACQSNRKQEGVDVFSTVAGGDGLARAATWQLFLDRVHDKESILDAYGNPKHNKQGVVMEQPSKNFKEAFVHTQGRKLFGGMLACDLRGRSVQEFTSELPFAHQVCSFDDLIIPRNEDLYLKEGGDF